MSAEQVSQGITAAPVLRALGRVERHRYLPEERQMIAYLDIAISLGGARVCARPSSAALLIQAAQVRPGDRILCVCPGSGYIPALLVELGATVAICEPDEVLAKACASALAHAGYAERSRVVHAIPSELSDRFEAAIVCGSVERTPRALIGLLEPNGVLVVPIAQGSTSSLATYSKTARGHLKRDLGEVDIDALPAPCVVP